jgi:hypothetical protein
VKLEWVVLNVGIEWDPKAVEFHVVAPKRSQQWHRHQWCIFLLFFDLCFIFLFPKLAFWFDMDWQVWCYVYNMSWSCWISLTWFKVKKGWKVFMDFHVGHHDLAFFKTHWSLNPLDLRWMVSKPKENIVGHKKERTSF